METKFHLKRNALICTTFLLSTITLTAQNKKDSIAESSDRGVMLNAKSTTEPRQIEIGLPMNYTAVSFNGLPAVYYYWPNTTSNHWRNEQLLAKRGLMTMPQVAVKDGEIGYGVDSWPELGGDKFKGKVNYGVNTFGAQNFDLNLSGPLGKGWYYTLSAYNNFDPGSFSLRFTKYSDRAQFYTGGLTKRWSDGSQLSFLYKFTDVHNLTIAANYAPFIWDGKGGVKNVPGFRIGRDSYLPVDGTMEYLDVRTGEHKQVGLYSAYGSYVHEGCISFTKPLADGMSLSLRAKVSTADLGTGDQTANGIITAKDNIDARYADTGEKYTGAVQKRVAQFNDSRVTDAFFTGELTKKTLKHDWALGLNEWYTYIDYARSTTTYYHEVAPNPRKLIYGKNSSAYENFNGSSEYDKGTENKLAAYIMDTWTPSDRFRMVYGLRLEYFHANVDLIPFARFNGFYIGAQNAAGKTVATENHTTDGLNYAVSIAPKYNITSDFGLTAEANFLTQYRHLEGYSGTGVPHYTHRPYIVGQAGIFYNRPWMELVSAFTYAMRGHDYGRIVVTNNDDLSQTPEMVNFSGGIRTIGWTTDAMFHPVKGFTLHGRFTLQSPKYTGYSFTAFNKSYSFDNSMVTKQSKVIVELDPRYSFGKFAVWANLRYYSKQYVNVANSIYFNGRLETFAGASYVLNDHVTFTANVTNFLGQTGAQGVIPSSDTVEDGSQFAGYMLTGNYILPFQTMLLATIRF